MAIILNGTIKNINQLNHFNQTPIACNITENKFSPKVFENLHGLKNIVSSEIFRHTGYYMPVFYEIELFNKDLDRNYIGNYKFDTTLSNFAVMRERKFRKINRKGSVLKLKNETDIRYILCYKNLVYHLVTSLYLLELGILIIILNLLN